MVIDYMSDRVAPEVRSRMMAAVRGKNTLPEKAVRKVLYSTGYRYRLHRRDLPGSPDIVLPRYRTVVFVHGCFWHGHNCPRGRRPASRVEFWSKKIDGNIVRDRRNQAALRSTGWHVFVIWECTLQAGCRRLMHRLATLTFYTRRPTVPKEFTR